MVFISFKRPIRFFTCLFLFTQLFPLSIFADSTILGSTGSLPRGILLDESGNIYTANSNDNTISKITPDGTSTVFATTGLTPYSLISDGSGNLYTVNAGDNTISKITPDGTSTIFATTGQTPYALVNDGSGNIYTANRGDNTISKITPDGTSTVFATTGSNPNSIIRDISGNLYTANFTDNTISKITPDGTSIVFATTGSNPYDLTIDSSGNIYVVNSSENSVSKITPSGSSTVLGNTGYTPVSILLDGSGCIYTLNYGSYTISKLSLTGSSYVFGFIGFSSFDMVMDGSGTLYMANYQGDSVSRVTPDTTPPSMNLYGGNEVVSYREYNYLEQSAYCYDSLDGYVSVGISGSVDIHTLGDYMIDYTCTDAAGNTSSQSRTVHVLEDTEPPVITLYGSAEMNLYLGFNYYEPGAYCMDNALGWCGNIGSASSGSVDVNNTGSYILTYSYTDIVGNTGSITRTVHVLEDTEPPVITLNGNSLITIPVGGTYFEPGAYCMDNADGWCGYIGSASSGSVDTDNTGTYLLTYSSVDAAGNTGTTLRTVNIGPDTTPPVINITGDNPLNFIGPQFYYDWYYPVTATDDDPTFDGVVTHTPGGSYIYMTEGDHTITYTATDPSGNTGTGVRFIHVTDNTPPYANLYTSQTVDPTPFLQGYINDPTATIEITIEGRTYTGVNSGTGNWRLPDNTISPALTLGNHTLDIRVVDPSGNIYTQNNTLTILPRTDLSLHMSLVNTGTISSGAIVTYRFDVKNEMSVDYTPNSLVQIVGLFPNSIHLGEMNTPISTAYPSITCQNYGPTENFGSFFMNYPAHSILLCISDSSITIPAGQSISFTVSFPVTENLPEGFTTQALILGINNTDLDDLEIQTSLNLGQDIFQLTNNNITHSVYSIPHLEVPTRENMGSFVGPSGTIHPPIESSNGINSIPSTQDLIHTLPIFPKVNPLKNQTSDTLVPSVDLNAAFENIVDSLRVNRTFIQKEIDNPLTGNICTKLVQIYIPSEIKTKDLPDNEFRESIQKLISYRIDSPENTGSLQGIVNNVDYFRGDQKITRGEFIKMLVRVLSCNQNPSSEKQKSSFLDISEMDESFPSIQYASTHNWISGYDDGTFRTNNLLSRAEAVKILTRAIQLDTSKTTIPPFGKILFDDVEKGNEFAPYVYSLMAHGIIQGKTLTIFSLDESITRQEVAKIFSKVFLGE